MGRQEKLGDITEFIEEGSRVTWRSVDNSYQDCDWVEGMSCMKLKGGIH